VQAAEIASIREGAYFGRKGSCLRMTTLCVTPAIKSLIFKDRACRVRLTGLALLTPKKTPEVERPQGFSVRSLAVTYSGMPERHTTIGAERFHFRVRNGIGWFPLAMAARQTVKGS
jgi:hypothetical protein